jgi:radical SAM superfamily enzyme YgiQ (UPF0313 family)
VSVLFFYPPSGDEGGLNFGYSLGSAYLIAFLRVHGIKAQQYTTKDGTTIDDCVNYTQIHSPKVIGFTVFDTNYIQCCLIAESIKRKFPHIVCIFGGPTPTVQFEEILKQNYFVDLCALGMGEETLLVVYRALESSNWTLNTNKFSQILGLAMRVDRDIIATPWLERINFLSKENDPLDKYPSPYISGVIPASSAYEVGILTARGCVKSCTYCNCAVFSNRKVLTHSVMRVVDELEYISNNTECDNSALIPVFDDAFTLIPSRAEAICKEIIARGFRLNLTSITRCDHIDEKLLDLMKLAGFKAVGFSLESAVPRILRIIGKVSPPEDIPSDELHKEIKYVEKLKTMVAYAKQIQLRVFISIMVGLPSESIEEANETIKLVKELDVEFYMHNMLTIYKGTPLYMNYEKYGYVLKKHPINDLTAKTIHHFDVAKMIDIAPRSQLELTSHKKDLETCEKLALSIKKDRSVGNFKNIVYWGNEIKFEFVRWMQIVAAINCSLIQIYDCLDDMNNYAEACDRNLYSFKSPTINYESYFLTITDTGKVLNSLIRSVFNNNEKIGFPIALTSVKQESVDKLHPITNINIENDFNDVLAIIERLKATFLDFQNNGFISVKMHPWVHTLCRWCSSSKNCDVLETAFVDATGNVRVCFGGDIVGDLSSDYASIQNHLKNLKEQISRERGCLSCPVVMSCPKCPCLTPVTEDFYCSSMRELPIISKGADLMRLLDSLKRL